MTLKKWVHDPFVLGNDQPFCKGQKETPGPRLVHFFGPCSLGAFLGHLSEGRSGDFAPGHPRELCQGLAAL